jgi:signal transduction histidine kinase
MAKRACIVSLCLVIGFTLIIVSKTLPHENMLARNVLQVDSLKILLSESKDPAEKVKILEKIVVLYDEIYDEKSLKYAKQIIHIARSNQLEEAEAVGHRYAGDIYFYLGFLDAAIENYTAAALLYSQLNQDSPLTYIYHRIATACFKQQMFGMAVAYKKREIEIHQLFSEDTVLAKKNYELALLLMADKKYRQALVYLNKALTLYSTIGDNEHQIKVLLEKARAYEFINTRQVPDVLNEALDLSKQTSHQPDLTDLYYQLGSFYARQENLSEAKHYLQKALQQSDKNNHLTTKTKVLQQLVAVFGQSEQYDSALFYQKKFQKAREVFLTQTNIEAITRLEQRYRFKQQEAAAEKTILQKETETTGKSIQNFLTKYALYWILLIIVLSGLTTSTFLLYKRKNRLQQKIKNLDIYGDNLSSILDKINEQEQRIRQLKNAQSSTIRFLADVSHDLRISLNSILGITELLKNKENLDAETMINLTILQNASKNLLNLANDILDLSKIEAGEVKLVEKPFQIAEAVESVVQHHRPLAEEKSLDLSFSIDDRLYPTYIGDEFRIKQVVNNFLSNAVKYTEEGHIRLSVTPFSEDLEKVRFEVQDTGKGISGDFLQAVFNPYQRSKDRKAEGTGLGLSISKRLVELMGGQIGVESKQGNGSIFWFYVPIKKISISKNI